MSQPPTDLRPEDCLLCGGDLGAGPGYVVVRKRGAVCWVCCQDREVADWGMNQFEAIVARAIARADQDQSVSGHADSPPTGGL